MAKRKQHKNIASIRWRDHAVALLVVILGVTIAFQLENWREVKRSNEIERLYLGGLKEDLQHDIMLVDTLLKIGEWQMDALNAILAMTLDRSINKDSLGMYLGRIQYSLPFTPQIVSYSAIKSEGMGTIKSHLLRRQIAEIYEQHYRGAGQFDASIVHHIETYVQPYCINNGVFQSRTMANPKILVDPVFTNIIFPLTGLMRAKLDFYMQMRLAIEKLQSTIAEELGV